MNDSKKALGNELHALASALTKPYRSITGEGVRESLRMLQEHIPLTIHEIKSGVKVFDWTVPREWNIRDAYVLDPNGQKIIDFKKNYLHVVGYSLPVDARMSLDELQKHLHSLPAQPLAIPYVTSYYKEYWGFCMTDRERKKLKKGTYMVRIDSTLENGSLTYGELIIPGKTKDEVLLSAYTCHPLMVNDNISGIVLNTFLAKWLKSEKRRYTYRIVFVPETIGSIAYMSRNLKAMRKTIAGFCLTCGGDERVFSYLPSRAGDTLADRVALNVLRHSHPDFISYSFLERGSDERQYCSPGADLPVATIMRSKYAKYPEYHTSLDDLRLVTPKGLFGTYTTLKECLEVLEQNYVYKTTCAGEPQLGKRGLYDNLSVKGSFVSFKNGQYMSDFLAYADGTRDLISIAEIIGAPAHSLMDIADTLMKAGVIARR